MWYKNGASVITIGLCIVTCVLAFNYWTLTQDITVYDGQLQVLQQKESDFNSVAEECKKRVQELHDKISVLTSDKEVISTQKNSLFSLASARLESANELERKLKDAEAAKDKCTKEKEGPAKEIADLKAGKAELEQKLAAAVKELEEARKPAEDKPAEEKPAEEA